MWSRREGKKMKEIESKKKKVRERGRKGFRTLLQGDMLE